MHVCRLSYLAPPKHRRLVYASTRARTGFGGSTDNTSRLFRFWLLEGPPLSWYGQVLPLGYRPLYIIIRFVVFRVGGGCRRSRPSR